MSFPQAYQQLAGDTCRGSLSSQLVFLLKIGGSQAPLTSTDLHSTLCILLSSYSRIHHKPEEQEDPSHLASCLLHDLLFPGQRRKASHGKEVPVIENLDLGDIENLFLAQPLLETVLQTLLLHLFSLGPKAPLAPLLPTLPQGATSSLQPLQRLLLNSHLPHELRTLWRPLFSTDRDGESFSKLVGAVVNQGPTLVVVWDEVGRKTGVGGFKVEIGGLEH